MYLFVKWCDVCTFVIRFIVRVSVDIELLFTVSSIVPCDTRYA